jgi:hypothetical protein
MEWHTSSQWTCAATDMEEEAATYPYSKSVQHDFKTLCTKYDMPASALAVCPPVCDEVLCHTLHLLCVEPGWLAADGAVVGRQALSSDACEAGATAHTHTAYAGVAYDSERAVCILCFHHARSGTRA